MARRDYFYDPEAPKPNSIRPAAAVALFDSGGNILLLRRKDNDKWTMPGGTLDFGESLTSCAIREVREETGLQIRITGLIGTYSDPNILIAYSDGEVRQEFTFVYAAEIESGELKIDDESKEAAWVPLSSAVELPLAESQRLQAEGRYGVSEGAADVFEVTPSSFRCNSEADSRCTEKEALGSAPFETSILYKYDQSCPWQYLDFGEVKNAGRAQHPNIRTYSRRVNRCP